MLFHVSHQALHQFFLVCASLLRVCLGEEFVHRLRNDFLVGEVNSEAAHESEFVTHVCQHRLKEGVNGLNPEVVVVVENRFEQRFGSCGE